MLKRHLSKLLLFLTSYCSFAQDLSKINKEIQKIDSLITYNQFKVVEKKTDSLYSMIQNSNYQEQILKVRLQKAKVLDNKNDHAQALSRYLDILSKAEKYKFYKIICESNILISLIHEKNSNLDFAYTYIKTALEHCKKFELEEFYSTILVRLSSIHRIIVKYPDDTNPKQIKNLEKVGFKASIDSAAKYAKQAIPYAQKFNNDRDLNDCYFLMGSFFSYQKKERISIEYFLKTIPFLKKKGDYETVYLRYNNVAKTFLLLNEPLNALKYSDSAYKYYDKVTFSKIIYPLQRSEIYHFINKNDSAYHYLQLTFIEIQESFNKQRNIDTKKLEEQYQNDKKEEIIKNKNRQMALIISLLVVIGVATVLVISKNRQISNQNKVIGNQLMDLKKNLEQKQILLSELQHRVKNNLQYVISILEIQKESVSFSNIDDLIKNNQNRIHSIALLHKKLNIDENVHDVDLKRYVTELSELVKESYVNEKKVNLFVSCEVETLSISKALPVGLIIVELVSNSMKHAFTKQPKGIINIEITKDNIAKINKLHYVDNGKGFDFNTIETKGLGVEIMKGLIDQLNGKIETPSHSKGFELIVYFKS